MAILRILLFPFALIYDMATRARNHFYNIGSKPSFEFDNYVIGVGNLSVGGTGKTPAIEYLVRLLSERFKLTTLSRGYGRKTKGYRMADDEDDANTLGDEPYQLYNKFKDRVNVAVGEQRALAIPEVLFEYPDNEVILLDDAFQHRSVKPNLNILLTDFSHPFFYDYLLPAGRLREARKGARRADIVIVTKCPKEVTEDQMNSYRNKIEKFKGDSNHIYFSSIAYKEPKPVYSDLPLHQNIILMTGIADNTRIREYVEWNYNLIKTITYSDHHDFTSSNINELISAVDQSNTTEVTILTTEKDSVRLMSKSIKEKLSGYSIYYLPIEMEFVKDGKVFDEFIANSIAAG